MSETIRETYGICSCVQGNGFIAGVELEIEAVKQYHSMPFGWNPSEDLSLRNIHGEQGGHEFISPPLGREILETHFKMIHADLEFYPDVNPYSPRTSIHVHVNCLDLTQQQVKNLVFWYALLEPVFFLMCKPERRNNIHCVGLDQTVLVENYRRSLPVLINKWSKYTALNLLPLKEQGTIEFRHMHGHDDARLFGDWLKAIEKLWELGQDRTLTKKNLTDETVLGGFDYVFKHTDIYSIRSNLLGLVEDNILDVKLGLD